MLTQLANNEGSATDQVVMGATGVMVGHSCSSAIMMKYLFMCCEHCCQRLRGMKVRRVYFVFVMRLGGKREG